MEDQLVKLEKQAEQMLEHLANLSEVSVAPVYEKKIGRVAGGE